MQKKLKNCDGCSRPKVIWKNHEGKKYCQECWGKHPAAVKTKPTPSKQYSLPARSSKQAKLERAYTVLRLQYLKDHPFCKMRIGPKCTSKATEVHHSKGRGEFLLDTTTWVPGCRWCHDWVEKHPEEAKALGLSEDRLTSKDETV